MQSALLRQNDEKRSLCFVLARSFFQLSHRWVVFSCPPDGLSMLHGHAPNPTTQQEPISCRSVTDTTALALLRFINSCIKRTHTSLLWCCACCRVRRLHRGAELRDHVPGHLQGDAECGAGVLRRVGGSVLVLVGSAR